MKKFNIVKAGMTSALALAMVSGGLLSGVAQAANHREAPISAFDRSADVTDWYTFRGFGGTRDIPGSSIVVMSGHDPLSEPSNGPNFFPFSNEILYQFNIDNNTDGREDIQVQWFFSRLNSGPDGNTSTSFRYPENFTGFAGIDSDVCISIPALLSANPICNNSLGLPNIGLAGNGRLAPINDPDPHWTQHNECVIPRPIASLVYQGGPSTCADPGLGLGEPQTYKVRILTLNSAGAVTGTFNISNLVNGSSNFRVIPANAGPRTYSNHRALSEAGIFGFQVPSALGGGSGKIFAGMTDEPFPVALGQSFDTINYSLECGGGVNTPQVELAQAGNCQPNDTDGYNVNTISIEFPTQALTGVANGTVGSSLSSVAAFAGTQRNAVIGTYGQTFRATKRMLQGAGQASAFASCKQGGAFVVVSINALCASDFTAIARMGNPLFNEVIVGTGCKDIFSQEDAEDDGIPGNCNGTGTVVGDPNRYPDVLSFVLDPYLPRLVNALVQIAPPIVILPIPLLPSRIGVLEAPDADNSFSGQPAATGRGNCEQSPNLAGRVGREDMLIFTNYCEFIPQIAHLTGFGGSLSCSISSAACDRPADLLRLNSNVPPTTSTLLRKRMGPLDNTNTAILPLTCQSPNLLGLLADPAGWPNGRRVSDDVIDGVVRVEMGALDCDFISEIVPTTLGAAPHVTNLLIGDASQGNDLFFLLNAGLLSDLQGYQPTFPYVQFALPGSNTRHIDETEIGCILAPGGICPPPSGGGV